MGSLFDTRAEAMQLVQIHGVNDVRLDSVPVPQCGDNDVIVAVQNCGICGSDLGYIAMGGLGSGGPMPIGHEMSARVIEVGANVSGVTLDDRVVVNPMEVDPPIGNFGTEGGFAPFLLVRDVACNPKALIKVDNKLSDEQAALVEPLSVGMHAVHRGEVTSNDKVVVFGAGTIGLSIAMVLKHYDVQDIVIVDTSAPRLKKAAALDLHTFQVGEDGDLSAFLQQHHGSESSYGMAIPATDVYLEATGVAAVFEQMVSLAKSHSRLVVVGVHKASASIDLVSVLSKELSIKGAMAYPDEFPDVLEMLDNISFDPAVLITHRYPLSDFHAALEMAGDTEQAVKVMIDCQS